MKRKHIIALCALTAAAVLGAAAGTGAYLTHRTAETVNTFAVGRLEAELTEPEWDKLPDEAKVLYPGKTVAKDPTACNAAESTTAAYMYLQVEIPRASVRTYTIEDMPSPGRMCWRSLPPAPAGRRTAHRWRIWTRPIWSGCGRSCGI